MGQNMVRLQLSNGHLAGSDSYYFLVIVCLAVSLLIGLRGLLAIGRLFARSRATSTRGPVVGVTPTTSLAHPQLAEWRELCVSFAGLPTLEVLQIDLGNFHTGVAHEPGEAVNITAAFEPGPGEGVAQDVGRDLDRVAECGSFPQLIENLLDSRRGQSLATNVGEEGRDLLAFGWPMEIDILPQELRGDWRDANLALFPPLAFDCEIALMHILEGELADTPPGLAAPRVLGSPPPGAPRVPEGAA